MLVSHRKRFIFTKTVKTAGTSVESYFEQWCMPAGDWQQAHYREEHVSEAGIIGKRATRPEGARWYNHMSASAIREQLGRDIWNGYFKFTVVRNPFDKLVSGYFMFGAAPQRSTREAEIRRFRIWLQNLGELFQNNRSLIESPDVPHYLKPLQASLFDRDKYVIDGEECVDFFIQYQNLNRDIGKVCEELNIPFEAELIPEFKKGIRPNSIPTREYFDRQSRALVQDLYGWEMSRFGYQLPA